MHYWNPNTAQRNYLAGAYRPRHSCRSLLPMVVRIVAVSCGYDTQFAVRLVMGYTISLLLGQFWDTFRIPHDQASPSQTHRCPGVSGSRQSDHVSIFDQIRLYSEIDHTYLSIEAQCVSHHSIEF